MRVVFFLLGAALTAAAVSSAQSPPAASSITGQSGEWDGGHRMYPFVLADGGEYKLYYSAGGRYEMSDCAWGIWHIGLATSTNGTGFAYRSETRLPVLWSRKYLQGQLLNPADLARQFDSVHAIGPCVRKDGAVYRMWYTGWAGEVRNGVGGVQEKINYRIGYATSKDGIDWTKRGGNAGAGSVFGLGPKGSPDSAGVGQPYVVKLSGGYLMYYEGFDGKAWRIVRTTSKDGAKWTGRTVALGLGAKGALDELGCRNPVLVKRKGQWELWYQGKSRDAPNYHVLRAASKDCKRWTRVPGEVVLHPPDAVAGSEGIYVDSVIVQPDGSCRVYFAKENTSTRPILDGTVENRRYSIYTEVVNP